MKKLRCYHVRGVPKRAHVEVREYSNIIQISDTQVAAVELYPALLQVLNRGERGINVVQSDLGPSLRVCQEVFPWNSPPAQQWFEEPLFRRHQIRPIIFCYQQLNISVVSKQTSDAIKRACCKSDEPNKLEFFWSNHGSRSHHILRGSAVRNLAFAIHSLLRAAKKNSKHRCQRLREITSDIASKMFEPRAVFGKAAIVSPRFW